MIPRVHTCDGRNVSPPLFWSGVPAEAKSLAALWVAQPARAVRLAKQAVYRSDASSLSAMLDLENAQQEELFTTVEAQHRIAAALEKRSH